jgi:hypothetical protein
VPLVSQSNERLLAAHDPPLMVAQFSALRVIPTGASSSAELARRAGVSGPAVSQLLSGLAASGLIERHEVGKITAVRHSRSQPVEGVRSLCPRGSLRTRLSSMLADLPRPEADVLARSEL